MKFIFFHSIFYIYICYTCITISSSSHLKQTPKITKETIDEITTEAMKYITSSESHFMEMERYILSSFSTTSGTSFPFNPFECNTNIYYDFKKRLNQHHTNIKHLILDGQPRITERHTVQVIQQECTQNQNALITSLQTELTSIKTSIKTTQTKLTKVNSLFDITTESSYNAYKDLLTFEKQLLDTQDKLAYIKQYNCMNWNELKGKQKQFDSFLYVSTLFVDVFFKLLKCPQHSSIILSKGEISNKATIQLLPLVMESLISKSDTLNVVVKTVKDKVGNGFNAFNGIKIAAKLYEEMKYNANKKNGYKKTNVIGERNPTSERYRELIVKAFGEAIGNGMKALNKIGRELVNRANKQPRQFHI